MNTTQWIIFISATVFLILFSWFVSIREKRYHGFPRFFVFEGLLLLGLLQWNSWFKDPLILRQLASWLFLILSMYYVFASIILYHRHTNHGQNFENSTKLVTSGLYKYVRHPMYASLLFLGWGMFLKSINLYSIILIVIITIALFITCKVEEKEMIKRFGEEYKSYMNKTKIWIPYII
jgi:protein-S-isoprenylcysteine O-methyltransferase Ste14